VSVAAALAVPVAAAGRPFPGREQIIFFAYVVVLATLVIPGLTLGPLVDWLGIGTGRAQAQADAKARERILQAAVEHLEELARDDALPDDVVDRLRDLYASRRPPAAQPADEEQAILEARRGAVAAQRATLAELRQRRLIGTVAAREVARELDLEERLCA
jgi:CPA1 family monovalent cation:H+ antiporter